MKDYVTFCKCDDDGRYYALRASEQLGTVYKEREKYSKKEWYKDLEDNGYTPIKTIEEEYTVSVHKDKEEWEL